MKKFIHNTALMISLIAVVTSCGMRRNNSRQIAEKDNRPAGTVNAPDSTRTSNSLSVYPDANPITIPNPNPNPPSPNPPM
ncbi:hypothetical protein [Mucilaginibacter ginkgonis]|uniref:Lipoprotein n=1 Tax=Mucilaginibacter ginkgonis TaxID=2682091 RepID=A0A6I4I1U5_9SPHI|nr:hypothetical protein [Mucilaginibacter ginkgonis]QQL50649.1 hypothetical protein GO620_004105 [Mucilaginibacter ginkgonis]